ncbi:MAG: hypothetical protein HZA50_05980 [Planctomycetes bacterium]|nr:hypothetical protein [Planctomycetota bacterium]
MKSAYTIFLVLSGMMVQAGCDARPEPPKPTWYGPKVEFIAVSPSDSEEQAAVVAAEKARVEYDFRLDVIKAYYYKVGCLDKYNWACTELNNLNESQTFRWNGLPQIIPPEKESLEGASEQLLAERVVTTKRTYLDAVEGVAKFYEKRMGSGAMQTRLVRNMQARFRPHETFVYIPEAEIPPADLKPAEVISAADALFERGLALYKDGKNLDLPAMADIPKLRKSLDVFREMIAKYPRSNKIALAAFYIGDVYRQYANNYPLAVRWLERAWQWDPHVPKPARYYAALTYDYKLHNRGRALELYRECLRLERDYADVNYATGRISDLTQPPEKVDLEEKKK